MRPGRPRPPTPGPAPTNASAQRLLVSAHGLSRIRPAYLAGRPVADRSLQSQSCSSESLAGRVQVAQCPGFGELEWSQGRCAELASLIGRPGEPSLAGGCLPHRVGAGDVREAEPAGGYRSGDLLQHRLLLLGEARPRLLPPCHGFADRAAVSIEQEP